MKKIKELEKVDESVNIKQQGVNRTFYRAYRDTIETDKKLLNFSSFILISDVPEIIKECKKFNIKEFTMSHTYAGFFNILAEFEKYNCKIAGMAKINAPGLEDEMGRPIKLDAIKMKIN